MKHYDECGAVTYFYVMKFGGATLETSGCTTLQEAITETVLGAVQMGWRPPRWWEFWRKREDLTAVLLDVAKNYRRRN